MSLFILEIALRITYPLYSNYNTEMWRYAKELKQISNIKNLGHRHVPNKRKILYGVEIKTNSLGLRANKEYAIPKPRGTKRILILGDSTTMGWGVIYNESYPYVLEYLLNKNSTEKFEVINAAVGNYNAINELEALKNFMCLEPDIIILGFQINDIEEVKYPSKFGYFIKKNLYLFPFIMDKVMSFKCKEKNSFRKYYLGLYNNEKLKSNLRGAINNMFQIAENKSIPFIFVNMSELRDIDEYAFAEVDAYIKKQVPGSKNVKYIDMASIFRKAPILLTNLWVSPEDPHPNAIAHHMIANKIYQELKAVYMLPEI